MSLTFPCPDRSRSIKPFSVPMRRLTPHNAAQRISELNRFLYFRISGVSLVASCCDVGVTLTFTWLSRREAPPELPAPNPNVRKLRCFCCKASECGWIKWGEILLMLWTNLSLGEEWWWKGDLWCGELWLDLVWGEEMEELLLTAARY